MASFLLNPRRRPWSPSQWNIVRASALVGATLALGACADDTVSGDDGVPETGDDATADSVDWSDEQTGYSDDSWDDYGDDYHDDDSWDDDYGDDHDGHDHDDGWDYGDDDYWTPECYNDEDCGPGAACVENYCQQLSECQYSVDCEFDEFCSDGGLCVGVDLPAQCQAPAFQAIPLPAETAGATVALSFVDLDGDEAEELVLVRSDAIVVVQADAGQASTIAHAGLALDGIAAADVDEDGLLDLIATSSTKQNARVFVADGLGGFAESIPGPLLRLDHAHGIDWPVGSAHELLARNQAHEAVVLSNLTQLMPQIEALELGVVEALGTADFDDDGLPDIIALQACSPLISYQAGDLAALEAKGPPGPCSLGIGDVDGDPLPDFVVSRTDMQISVVTMYATSLGEPLEVGLYGGYSAVLPTNYGNRAFAVLAQTGAELDYAWAGEDHTWCRSTLPAPPILRFAAGDSDGDGDDEIATVDQAGAVQLWSYN
ncbi:VCBS repeat-containing protein [Enhygromyxa salina]|nr:VCBS repeat-containing protein [Enhygromyxa salina]